MPAFPLQSLPEELLELVLGGLEYSDLCSTSLTSRWSYTRVIPLLWKHLKLVDRSAKRTVDKYTVNENTGLAEAADSAPIDQHDETRILQKLFVIATNPYVASKVQTVLLRCHLYTPELFQELPALRHDDTISYKTDVFGGRRQGSTYVRLILQAVSNMINVHTLKIILGHCGLTQALIWGFFGPHRTANIPVKKLWLETCCPRSPDYDNIWTPLDFSKVESLHLRRLWFQFFDSAEPSADRLEHSEMFTYARGEDFGQRRWLRNSTAGFHPAYLSFEPAEEWASHYRQRLAEQLSIDSFCKIISDLPCLSFLQFIRSLMKEEDATLSSQSPTHRRSVQDSVLLEEHLKSAHRMQSMDAILRILGPGHLTNINRALWPKGNWECSSTAAGWRLHHKYEDDVIGALQNRSLENMYFCRLSQLTSLTLDWIIFQTGTLQLNQENSIALCDSRILSRLCELHFPHLRAFQMRNCITESTQLSSDIYLFAQPAEPERKGFIDFLEAHPVLESLAWPMNRFFPPKGLATNLISRVEKVINNLAQSLVDLRVDALLSNTGEPNTGDDLHSAALLERHSRCLFVTEFASHMRRLTSIKLEGGIPRDEKRETVRALMHCPLTKIVFIGASFPLANTWGQDGQYFSELIHHDPSHISTFEHEDRDMLSASLSWSLPALSIGSIQFEARFGRDVEPMLYTIASFHADTIKELKFCGYSGASVLQDPGPMTPLILHHLKRFANLRELVISFQLLTMFDGERRDHEIIKYWTDMRNPQSTAIAIVPSSTSAAADQNLGHEEGLFVDTEVPQQTPLDAASWMYSNFHPTRLEETLKDFIGPYCSPIAKAHGLRLRASFCLGQDEQDVFNLGVQDIFDFDVGIGLNSGGEDQVLDYLWPREDSWDAGGRSEEKLARRRWF